MTPDVDPVAAGQRRADDLQAIIDALNAPNPCLSDMNLPGSLLEDGAN